MRKQSPVALGRAHDCRYAGHHFERRRRTADATRRAATSASSCSQKRTTPHPAARSNVSVSASRDRFRSIFARHHSPFATGQEPCLGQPCQKHPSTNTATCSRGNTTSARRLSDFKGALSTRNLRPRRCRRDRRASSAGVSRDLTCRMRLLAFAEEGVGAASSVTVGKSCAVQSGSRRNVRPTCGTRLSAYDRTRGHAHCRRSLLGCRGNNPGTSGRGIQGAGGD